MNQYFKYLKNDIPAAIVVFLVALPLCLGIALASGAPLFSGIIAGIIGGAVVGILSNSQLGVSGPAAGLAVIVLNGIKELSVFENFLLAVVLCGVFQVIFGLFSLINVFLDREALWTTPILKDSNAAHILLIGWCGLTSVLILLSLMRVFQKVQDLSLFCVALSKLLSPFALSLAPFLLPSTIIQSETRFLSLAFGFCFSILTIKIIVSSMAKMSHGSLQIDVLPMLVACMWLQWNGGKYGGLVLRLLSLLYGIRLTWWVSSAIQQICQRLDIYCFSIKQEKVE